MVTASLNLTFVDLKLFTIICKVRFQKKAFFILKVSKIIFNIEIQGHQKEITNTYLIFIIHRQNNSVVQSE